MTRATILKKYEHFSKLVNDETYRNGFAMSVEKDGLKLNTQRSELIKSDAQRHLKRLLEKFPDLKKPEVKEEKPKETKSKGKK